MIDALLEEDGPEAKYNLEVRIRTSLKALGAIANHVAGIPGRKNLVWVSAAFPLIVGYPGAGVGGTSPASTPNPVRRGSANPRFSGIASTAEREQDRARVDQRQADFRRMMTFEQEVTRAVRALNDANLAVYPVDARGLSMKADARDNIATIKELANRSGGKAFYNRNDIRNSIREAVADTALTYTLAYYPGERKGDGEFREIKVKAGRPGLALRHRRGYFDSPDGEIPDPQLRDAALADAAWSPLDATSVHLDVRLAPLAGGRLSVHLTIDPAGITLEPRDGKWRGKLDLLRVETDAAGNGLTPESRTLTIDATGETYREIRKSGLVFRWEMARRPEAATLKIVVRDAPTGNLGSLAIPYNRITAAGAQ